MTHDLVRIFCPECNGESSDPVMPSCDYCLNNGHFDIDRNEDGSIPAFNRNGTPVRLFVDTLWPPVRRNPLRLTFED